MPSSEWEKVIRYLESPYLTPDNNAAERSIRPFVLGRKNWLFAGSPRGADASCFFYSMIETAKENGLNPYGYLKWVFETAPWLEKSDYEKLLPWNCDREQVNRYDLQWPEKLTVTELGDFLFFGMPDYRQTLFPEIRTHFNQIAFGDR